MKKIKITVSGRVQGVFFRAFTYDTALRLNIKGYVKNLYNGNVEAVAIGSEEDVEKFINELKIGPLSAHVDNIEIEKLPDSINYDSFKINY
ncbi:MAG: acylphosphatase [Candidatus Cloacimonetes bacterium]|nr:acylphosphatase [Candidatus Cloacimonadota bacterium]MBL7086321.1 acylphosphatase [Candidatus Cloacimonadota bacterium]